MTPNEEETKLDNRMDYLLQTHKAGNFHVNYYPAANAVLVTDLMTAELLTITAYELKRLAATLMQVETTLYMLGLVSE